MHLSTKINKLKFYVYAYLRSVESTTGKIGTPYYIGKGNARRAYTKHAETPVPTDKSKIVFLETNLTELGAFALERRYIRWYGRKDLGTGILLNRTNGGEGATGLVQTEAAKQAHSKRMKGENNPMFGKTHSIQSIDKIRRAITGNKLSDAHKEAVGAAHRGTKLTEEHRAKCSAKLSGTNNPNYGKKISEEQKTKFRATLLAKKLAKQEP